ncbi:MAG: acyltransferase [Clostridiales bacterium]|nr:acyltransferase [Clostridiales bacterium]
MNNNNNKTITNETLMNKRETDWFRGIAALMVVLSHYGHWWNILAATEGNIETFRFALTKLGVYGVDIFFLFSGYAMIKSLGDNKMSWTFVWKRIKNVYLPYFLIIGFIELISDGLNSLQDLWFLICGYKYWYMMVLFLFYIGFIVIYALIRIKWIRVLLFCLFTYVMSYILYKNNMSPFWYVSNIAFAIGLIAGEYEETFKKIIDKIWIYMLIILSIGMIFITKWGLEGGVNWGGNTEDYQIWVQIGATVVWTLLILILASKCRIKEPVFAFLGKSSLYLYLTHVFVAMRCINFSRIESISVRFIISPICIIAVALLCNLLISCIWKLVSRLASLLKKN